MERVRAQARCVHDERDPQKSSGHRDAVEQTDKLGTNLWLATSHVPPSNAHKCAVARQLAELDGDSEASRWPKAMMDGDLLVVGFLGCIVCDHRRKDSTTARN